MNIMHMALGGCLKAPPVAYGVTEDTGGHIAYLLGAAAAQAARADVDRITLVTRLFEDPALDPAHARPRERVDRKTTLLRLATANRGYLAKEALEAELPALEAAFLALLEREGRPDVIHAHFADAAALALAARARWGVPVVYTPHSLGLDKRGCLGADAGLMRRIARERRAIERADAVVVSSRDEAEGQIEAYGMSAAGRTHRLDPGVHLPGDRRGLDRAAALLAPHLRDPSRPLLLAIARPVAKKNLHTLLRAFAETPGLADRANLAILAGQASDASGEPVRAGLRALVAEHGLEGRVALPPSHDGTEVAQLYRLAARSGGAFVNPALHEPFGLTLIEAAQAGLPVVATRHGGPRDILAAIGHGIAVEPTDAAAIGAACLRLVTDPAERGRRAEAARRNRGRYTWTAYAARSVALYGRLARGVDAPALRLERGARALVVCDIDGTLTGDRDAAARFADWVHAGHAPFAIATGRSVTEARRVLAEWALPEPHAMITSVGSEIWYRDAAGRAEADNAFAAAIAPGWDAEAVTAALAAAGARPQAAVEQRAFKRSYLGDAAEAARLRGVLRAAGLRVRLVHSHGRLVDVLPARAGKAAAMLHVAGLMGLGPEACVAAGDSGNDLDMLRAAGAAILPRNALPELDGLLRESTAIRARAPHAAGVLEGLARLGLAPARARPPLRAEALAR